MGLIVVLIVKLPKNSKNIEIANGHNLTYIIARILHYILKVRENLRASLESDRAMVRDVYMIWGCYQELKRMIFRKSSKQPLPRSDVDEGNADFIQMLISFTYQFFVLFCHLHTTTILVDKFVTILVEKSVENFGGKLCGNFLWKILVYMPYLISLKLLL